MNAKTWRVRGYRPGDERVLAALWTEAFGRPMSEEFWRWKCKGRPSQVENVGVAVDADDRPIGQFVGIPSRAMVLGRERSVMVGADVVTAPEFRRRGVFTAVARHLFDCWREAGVALVLGLANDRWGSRAEALGYRRYFKLHWLVRPLRPERVLARRSGVAILGRRRVLGNLWNTLWDAVPASNGGVTVRELREATRDIDAIWERAAPRAAFSLVRDSAWVQWRYFDFPGGTDPGYRVTLADRAGSAVGWAAYRVARQGGTARAYLADAFAPGDSRAVRALVRDVVARCQAADADIVVTLAVPGSDLYRAARRAGFVFNPGAYRLEAVRLDAEISDAALANPRAWWIAGGDFDVV